MPLMTASSEMIERLHRRASVRAFGPLPVPASLLDDLLAAAVRAPTSFNFQAYCLIVVTAPARRQKLADLIDQRHVAQAPVVVVVCADVSRLHRLGERFGEPLGPEHRDLITTAVIDASLAGMCLALVAESVGLGTVMVGAVRNRPAEVADVLGLPDHVSPLFGVCVGWPEQTPPARPRLRADLLSHSDRYEAARAERALHADTSTLWKPGQPVAGEEAAGWRFLMTRGLGRARRNLGVSIIK